MVKTSSHNTDKHQFYVCHGLQYEKLINYCWYHDMFKANAVKCSGRPYTFMQAQMPSNANMALNRKKNNIPLYSLISDPPAWTVFDTIKIISFIVDRAAGCSVVSSAF